MASLFLAAALAATSSGLVLPKSAATAGVNTTTCNGKTYVYDELAGYGYVPSDAVDKFGDTLGGYGSAIHMDQSTWTKLSDGSYTGTLWAVPDRGWNTEGTLNYWNRVHKFNVVFTPNENATADDPASPNLILTYLDSIRLTGPDGTPCTGLDGDVTGHLSYPGFPDMPVSTFTGDGFGSNGTTVEQRIPLDSEGLVVNSDGSFWISDEYGPYVYLFDASGKMLSAIRPPEALVPYRNGAESWSSDSPPIYDQDEDIDPADPDDGRENNHGFEGLSVSEDGKTLWVLLQAAAVQDGGTSSQTEENTRLLEYDISDPLNATYLAEYVVTLPFYTDPTAKSSKNPKVAAQSELHALPNGQFFVLARDSNAGHGQTSSLSVYRHIDVFDISSATDIKAAGGFDCETCAVASSKGKLNKSVVPAEYCSFLDYNVNSQLERFGLHNGGDQDAWLLNEKWESITVVPVVPQDSSSGDYYVFSLSDNDFITQNGYMNGGDFRYEDSSGYNLDNQALVFKVTVPN